MAGEAAVYNKKQFIEAAINRGYAKRSTCLIYMQNNPKLLYTEDDLIEVYRFQERDTTSKSDPWEKGEKYGLTPEEKKQAERDSWL